MYTGIRVRVGVAGRSHAQATFIDAYMRMRESRFKCAGKLKITYARTDLKYM